jgi:hypothetical protein
MPLLQHQCTKAPFYAYHCTCASFCSSSSSSSPGPRFTCAAAKGVQPPACLPLPQTAAAHHSRQPLQQLIRICSKDDHATRVTQRRGLQQLDPRPATAPAATAAAIGPSIICAALLPLDRQLRRSDAATRPFATAAYRRSPSATRSHLQTLTRQVRPACHWC